MESIDEINVNNDFIDSSIFNYFKPNDNKSNVLTMGKYKYHN